MNIKQFFLFILAGMGLHQAASFTQKLPLGFESIVGSAVGIEGTFPLFLLMLKSQGASKKEIERAAATYQLSFLCVGIGVAAGWLVDFVFKVRRK